MLKLNLHVCLWQGVRGTSILGQGILTTAALTSSTVTTASAKQGPPPMVAKVVTNSHGQLITMEALQAQSKAGRYLIFFPYCFQNCITTSPHFFVLFAF